MSWQEAIAFTVVLASLAVGLSGAAFLYFRNPAFWVGFFVLAVKKAWPLLLSLSGFVFKRKTPEEEARDHQDVRQRTERTITGRERYR